jgi:hypothetical protein
MALVAGATLVAGCGSGSSSSGTANVRLLNATAGYGSLDLALDTVVANKAVLSGAVGSYASASTSGVSTVVSVTGSTSALSTATRTLSKDTHYTLIAYGSSGALKTALIQEDVAAAAANVTSLQVLNLAPDAGAVDVYLTGNNDAIDSATAMATNIGTGSSLPYTSVTAGTYRLRVTGAGSKTDLRLDVQGLVLTSTQVASLVLTEGAGGVLVNSVLLVQQGAATGTTLANSQARVRVIAAVSNGAIVTANVAGSAVATGVTAPNIGAYTQVAASTGAPVVLSVNNVQVPVANQLLLNAGDYTMLVWGDAAAPQVTLLADDNRFPTVTGNANVRLINASSGAATSLTMKVDFSVVAQSVGQGQASAYTNVPASTTSRLDVTSATGTPAAYTTSPVTFVAKGLYTFYVLGDSAAPLQDFRKER